MIVTTSWDDGHPLDFKILELLEKYNLKGTFYIPLTNSENQVMDRNMINEISKFQEIGGHTINHKYLNLLNDKEAEIEITQCKVLLEEIIGQPIFAFCFPGGKYSNRDVQILKNSGFLFGRTTNLLSSTYSQSNLMNTTIQAYNHRSSTLIKHCVKRFNFKAIIDNSFLIPFDRNFLKLAEYSIHRSIKSDGVFHIWGHSWEIEKYNLWPQIEDLFKILSVIPDIKFLSNTETWEYKNTNVR